MAFKIGQTVTYRSASKGETKIALITGTPDTVVEGTNLPTLNPDQYAVMVFSPTGSAYGKYAVPDATAEGFNAEEYTIDGVLRGVLLPVE